MLRIRRLKISLRMTARCNVTKSNVNASPMISSGVSNDGSMVDPPMRKTEAGWCSVFHQSTENLIIGRLTAPTSDRIAAARAPRPGARGRVPAVRVVPPYYDHPAYLDAVEAVIRADLAALPWEPEHFVVSFHGIPQSFVDSGDPYASHCEATAKSLAAQAGWDSSTCVMAYQSRAGREPWLLPNTDDTFVELARTGLRHIMVICPGFVADCLETIDEIGYVGLQQFQAAGGETLQLVACLNDRPRWIAAMTEIAVEQLQGWL